MTRRTDVRLVCLLCGALILAGAASRAGAQTPDFGPGTPDSTAAAAVADSAQADSSSTPVADTTAAPPDSAEILVPGLAVPAADTTVTHTLAPVGEVPNA